MRAAVLMVLLLALPAAAGPQAHTAAYTANPGQAWIRYAGGNAAGIGGVALPAHPHATTATVTVADAYNGAIAALVCQDLDDDRVCNVTAGSNDVWACASSGSLSSFPIQAAPPGSRLLLVLVAGQGFVLEGCNVAGAAVAGTVNVAYA